MHELTMMQEQQPVAAAPNPTQPQPHRRPRVREVSSRFMSPIATSSSSSLSPLPTIRQRSSSVQKQRRQQEMDSDCSPQKKHYHQRAVVKLFKENDPSSSRSYSHRPDTPTLATTASTSSKLRLMQQRSTSNINSSSAATKLLQSSTSGISNSADSSSPDHDNSTNNANNDVRISLPDLRSSTPEADANTNRFLAERNLNRLNQASSDSSKFAASPCSRSLNLPRSTSDHSLFHSLKSAITHSVKLPPVPPCSKVPIDASRKARKFSTHQEEVHSLRLLHNHYLQWRYVNAKAEASTLAQRRETERTLYSLGVKIRELYNLMKRKRIELGLLQRMKTLSTIVDAQMPCLDEWFAFEMDYSLSLSEAIQALLNASLQVPISGNVRADVKEVGEALKSATKLLEAIAFHIESLMPKAEEIEHLISELARVTGGERALIDECGDLLFVTYNAQVEEWSLRGQLIQSYETRVASS